MSNFRLFWCTGTYARSVIDGLQSEMTKRDLISGLAWGMCLYFSSFDTAGKGGWYKSTSLDDRVVGTDVQLQKKGARTTLSNSILLLLVRSLSSPDERRSLTNLLYLTPQFLEELPRCIRNLPRVHCRKKTTNTSRDWEDLGRAIALVDVAEKENCV